MRPNRVWNSGSPVANSAAIAADRIPENASAPWPQSADRSKVVLLGALLALVLARLWLMAYLPLTDTTEGRYGELARQTVTGGYWLMPHLSPSEPFFAKPPLSTWLAAAGWKFLGQNELALRLPSLLMTLITMLAVLYGAKSLAMTRWQVLFAAVVVATSPLGFVSAGAVMTDATQLAIVTWAMVLAWRALTIGDGNADRFGFWAVIGVGALAKGLATWALIGLPIALFLLLQGDRKRAVAQMARLWSLPGAMLAAIIALAWYVPAEKAYPGFLKYFIVGEHFQRFLTPGWHGDRFGSAHHQPIGMIWVFWAVAIVPWFPLFARWAWRECGGLGAQTEVTDKWLWAWTLAPLLFFTLARNIIATYPLTALPAFSVLVARRWPLLSDATRKNMGWVLAAWVTIVVVGSVWWAPRVAEAHSTRSLVARARAEDRDIPLYVLESHKIPSASYYSGGPAQPLDDMLDTGSMRSRSPAWVILNAGDVGRLKQAGDGAIVASAGKTVLFRLSGTAGNGPTR